MFITDPEEIKSVARHRWAKQYFTKTRKKKFISVAILWMLVISILLSTETDYLMFSGLGVFIIGIFVMWRWDKKKDAQIDIMIEKIKREG